MSERAVIVLGDLMVDQSIRMYKDGVNPEGNYPRYRPTGSPRNYLGGAANVAANVKAMGVADVVLIGYRGWQQSDPNSCWLCRELVNRGIRDASIIDNTYRLTLKSRYYVDYVEQCRPQLMMRLDHDTQVTLSSQAAIASHARREIEKYAAVKKMAPVVVFSDYEKGCLTDDTVTSIMATCLQYGCPILVDPPKFRAWKPYASSSTIFKCNRGEAYAFIGTELNRGMSVQVSSSSIEVSKLSYLRLLHAMYDKLMGDQLAFRYVWLTLGVGGHAYRGFDATDGTYRRALPTSVTPDVCGAGDTAIAALSAALARGETPEYGMHWGNVAAGLAVRVHGTHVVTKEEFVKGLTEYNEVMRHATSVS